VSPSDVVVAYFVHRTRRPAIATRQKEARRLSKLFFAPRTRIGISLRNVLMKLFSVPFLFKSVVSPAMAEADFLPDYGRGNDLR